uniref:Zinc transporter 2 n=1 Tax=Globodera rostochiensis TaxID=31243 RepID=A0A914HSR2_GLORO
MVGGERQRLINDAEHPNSSQQLPGGQNGYGATVSGTSQISASDGDALGSSSSSDGFHCHADDDRRPMLLANDAHGQQRARTVLWLSVGVCFVFMICEVIGGALANSLAIITDAAHLLTDLASMLISLFSLYIASRPASQRMSFGWHRAEVVGAFISVVMIWVLTGILMYLALERMIVSNYSIQAGIMAITAAIGVGVNLIMALLLYLGGHSHSHSHHHDKGTHSQRQNSGAGRRGYEFIGESAEAETEAADTVERQQRHGATQTDPPGKRHTNINVRAAFIHVLGDLIQSVGVLFAGLLIYWKPNWAILDPICTLLFSVIVLSTTIYIIRDALVVLLEGRPSNIDFRHVFDALEHIEGVKKVHDLRIWALTMDKIAISVHLEVEFAADSQQILKATTLMLRRDFNVHESTIQIEGYQPETANCGQCVIPPK